MPPKKDAKGTKEQDAEQKLKERRTLLNNLREENKKYGITQILPGLELMISEYMIENLWDHNDPFHHMKECMYYQLQRLEINDKFKLIEQDTIANQMVYSMIFSKNDANMDNCKTAIVCNLIWSLFRNNDERYQNVKIPLWSESMLEGIEEMENLDEWIQEKTPSKWRIQMPSANDLFSDDVEVDVRACRANKSKDTDMAKFKSFIKEITSMAGSVPDTVKFTKDEVMRLVQHVFKSYFEKYDLFNYSITYKQAEEEIFVKTVVDSPQFVAPLGDSNFLGKIIQEEERLKLEEEMRQANLEKDKVEEEIRLEREAAQRAEDERWAGLDDKTIQMIKDKISETRDFMEKELDTKKEEYAEKIENAKHHKGGKKK